MVSSTPASLTIDELTRLQVSIRIQHTPAGMTFSMHPTYHPGTSSSHGPSTVGQSSHSVYFQTSYDEHGPLLQVFAVANVTDSQSHSPGRKQQPPAPTDTLDFASEQFLGYNSTMPYAQSHASVPNPYPSSQQYEDSGYGDYHQVEPTSAYRYHSTTRNSSLSPAAHTIPTQYASGSTTRYRNAPQSPSAYSVGSSEDGSSSGQQSASPESYREGDENGLDVGAGDGRFPCGLPECPRRFTSQYTLKLHMDAHKPKQRKYLPCSVENVQCDEKFSRQHDRLRHEVQKHGRVSEFICEDCKRFFSSKRTLGSHKCPSAVGGGITRWIT